MTREDEFGLCIKLEELAGLIAEAASTVNIATQKKLNISVLKTASSAVMITSYTYSKYKKAWKKETLKHWQKAKENVISFLDKNNISDREPIDSLIVYIDHAMEEFQDL